MNRRIVLLSLLLAAGPAAAHSPAGGAAHYLGILPCANCPALRVDLTLVADARDAGTYDQRWTYIGKNASRVTHGAWKLKPGTLDGAQITLYELGGEDKELLLKDGERALRLVDDTGHDLPSPRPQVLWRTDGLRKPITVTQDDSGRKISMRPGEELLVRVHGNASTGYEWKLADTAQPVLAPSGAVQYERDPAPANHVGVGGVETWRFAAAGVGHQQLELRYQRPWEPAPTNVISFDVEVTIE